MRLKLSCHCNGISYRCIVPIPPHAQYARNNSLNKNQPDDVILRRAGHERGNDMPTVNIMRFSEKSLLSKPLIETVSKCVWLLVAMMEMASNLTTAGRFFQVFALLS